MSWTRPPLQKHLSVHHAQSEHLHMSCLYVLPSLASYHLRLNTFPATWPIWHRDREYAADVLQC